jgi:competence protein ComEC
MASAERSRWSLWLPVALGAGVGVYFSLPFEPAPGVAIASAGAALAAGAIAYTSSHSLLRVALALVAASLIGFTAAKAREEMVAAPVLSAPVGPASLDGRVDYAQSHGKGIRVVLSHLRSYRFEGMSAPSRVRISFRSGAEVLRPGDTIRATAVLMPPPGPAAPDAYDFARTAFFGRIGAVGYAYGGPDVISRASASPLAAPLEELVARLRFRMTERIHEVLPGSTGAIASALITGDRGGISDLDESSLRDAGLAHVLAIAGLHMALVGLGIFWLVRSALAAWPRVALHYPIKKWSALAALAAAAFYLVISGAGAPSIRAFTMLAMMLLAVLFDRPALTMRAVALAASIILILEPESLVEPGFQMSFSAVVGLIAVAEWEHGRTALRATGGRPVLAGVTRYARGIATTSFVGSIATMPYAIFHFDRATHYAVLGNLLAMPIMGFVAMPAAALSVALMPLGLDIWPLRIMGLGIAAMLSVGRWVSTLPGAISVVAAWPISALVLMSLGGLWCAIWKKRWRWFGLVPMLLGTFIALTASAPDLLVARDARTVAVRGSNGTLHLIGRARDGYSANEWLKRDGDERAADEAIASPTEGARCDSLGCRAQVGSGITIAKVLRAEALEEDCANAEILVSAVAIDRPCIGPKLVLDLRRVTDSGGYAVWFSPFAVQSVQEARGDRPWSTQPSSGDLDQ